MPAHSGVAFEVVGHPATVRDALSAVRNAGTVVVVGVSDPAATKEPFRLSYDVSRPNFLDWSKKKTQVALPLVQFSLPDVDPDDPDNDGEPLKLGPKGEYSYKVTLELPAKYSAQAPLIVFPNRHPPMPPLHCECTPFRQ